jgi:P4 family phage/plasmid primase-like protien
VRIDWDRLRELVWPFETEWPTGCSSVLREDDRGAIFKGKGGKMENLKVMALKLHSMGANVLPILEGKRPAIMWTELQTRRQTLTELEGYDWGQCQGVGVICGISDWRCIDIDQAMDRGLIVRLLLSMHLPEDYVWTVRTGSGKGWHVWLRCQGALSSTDQLGVVVGKSRDGEFKQLELRWHSCQALLPPSLHASGLHYEWAFSEPCDPPEQVSFNLLRTSFDQLCVQPMTLRTNQRPVLTKQDKPPLADRANRVPILEIAQELFHGECVDEGGGEYRIKGHGGLLVNPRDNTFYSFRERVGGGPATMVGLSLFGPEYDHTNDEQRRAVARYFEVHSPILAEAGFETFERAVGGTFPLTDLGNCARFVRQFRGQVHYVDAWGKWLVWDGTRWLFDASGRVVEFAKTTVRSIVDEARREHPVYERKRLMQFAQLSQSRARIQSILNLARTELGISAITDDFDTHPMLLNLLNGTFDLESGECRPHNPADLITDIAPVSFDSNADAPDWTQFLRRVFGQNDELIRFVQRAVGYSLCGDTSEQCLFFAWGTGKNGKSVFFEVLHKLLGEYWQKAPTEMIMQRQSDGVPNDIARLKGARLVVTAEIEQGRRLNESKIKDLTGSDMLTARFLHQEFFEFRPTHKLWIYGNHKPIIKGTDEGIWRRFNLIPFSVTIPEAERKPMTVLLRTMQAQLSGILNWALVGYREYRRIGLQPPADVLSATEEYRSEMDGVQDFLNERCFMSATASVRQKDLYLDYKRWCEDNGEVARRAKEFNAYLRDKGYETRSGHSNYTVWNGIALKVE